MPGKTSICSIFGQIESVVADAMVKEGLCNKIDRDMIPESVRWNDRGEIAYCALVFTPEAERIFDRRVRELRR